MDQHEVFMLWVNLERAYFDGPDENREVPLLRLVHPPWESPDSHVQAAWQKLTSPENLEGLIEWHQSIKNGRVDSQAAKAVEVCRQRAKDQG
ncbi:MAG: hypothetical protein P1V97_26245 [Planctomycetota bacterium]|nr:hypothetical protein [Planctomycetota bacterium]